MGFNLMAALGGAGRAMSQSIQEDRLQMDKMELMDAEAATRERLAKAAEKREEDKANEKLASRLKGMGFDQGRIAYIMAQGSGFAESMIDHATQAYANGKDPNTILKYSENIDEFKTVSGVKPNESMLPEGFVLDPEIPEISNYFDLDSGVTSTLYVTPSEKQTLEEMRRDIQTKLIEGNWTKEDFTNPNSEWNQLTKKSLSYTQSIKELAEAKKGVVPEDKDDDTDIYSRADARNELRIFMDRTAPDYKLESLEGVIQNVEAGVQGRAGVARLDANIAFKKSITETGKSVNASSVQVADYDAAIGNLQNVAIQTAAIGSQAADPVARAGIGARYKMPQGKATYTFNEIAQMKGGKPDNVEPGDVIVINNKIAIYTGFTHTYGQYGTGDVDDKLVIPYVFANIDNELQYTITDTTR